ncbi:hypothetical protein Pmani_038485 [Petrolisthes manimaculis]|uniref:L-serine ammonia-lyase n=1 Tax=Petrolisthes manimaculis TaxID=1843537 RepID=A0AAE1NEC1_9EUCA|nr:hypothetical protein Pmani_038485 [Petrolisthes manimaculis]
MESGNLSQKPRHPPLHIISPLVESPTLSEVCGRKVLLKLDNTQPAGSFKIRGIGHLINKKHEEEGCMEVVSSSGGNAGMAAACAAKALGLKATIVLPESTPRFMIPKLQQHKAEVIVHGKVWNEAHEEAIKLAKRTKACLVHPFDHLDIWDGHSTIVKEILDQCNELPAAVVVSVGGGGLLCGILKGLHSHGVQHIPVVAMETVGADCLNVALKAGKPVSIGDITSIAKTLGALTVTQGVFDLKEEIHLYSHVVTDKEAVAACARFADDHQTLVEPACGATLAAGYSGIVNKLVEENKIPTRGPIVFVVCGGNVITTNMLLSWKKEFNID